MAASGERRGCVCGLAIINNVRMRAREGAPVSAYRPKLRLPALCPVRLEPAGCLPWLVREGVAVVGLPSLREGRVEVVGRVFPAGRPLPGRALSRCVLGR